MRMKNEDGTNSSLSRRDLLKMIGGAAGAMVMYDAMESLGLMTPSVYAGPVKLEGAPKGTSVLVLGAGIAGMVAAYELRKAGYKVQVLEYLSRPGGRCWTIHGGESYTELGGYTQKCQFAKGDYLNPGPWRIPCHHFAVMDYCRELGVPLEPFFQLNMNAYYHSEKAYGGKPQRIKDVVIDMQGHVSELLAKSASQNKLDEPLTKEDQEKLLEALKTWGGLDKNYKYTAMAETSAEERRGFDVEPGGGLQPRMMSSKPLELKELLHSGLWKYVQAFQTYEFHQSIFQPVGGMFEISKAFARELKDVIVYNTRVSKIAQNEKGVTVTCMDLTTKKEKQVRADWCVCTIPLSILSQLDVQVAKPMKEAIDAVPYNTGFKAGIQFKRRFWEEDERIFGGITYTDLPLNNIGYPMQGINKGGTGVVLAAYNFGPEAYKWSAMIPEDRLQNVLELFTKIHPQAKKEFDNGFTMAWHRAPWVNGCHGMWTEETREKHYNDLCAIDGRIVLAGEHASFWPAWLEGAVLSSQDAITRLHKKILS